jgi:hypothetical protein
MWTGTARPAHVGGVAPPPHSRPEHGVARLFALPLRRLAGYDDAVTREPQANAPMTRNAHMPIAATLVAGGAFARAARPWSGRFVTAAPHSKS